MLTLNAVMRFLGKQNVDDAFMQTQANVEKLIVEREEVHYLNIDDTIIFNFLLQRGVSFKIRPRNSDIYNTFHVFENIKKKISNLDLGLLIRGDIANEIAAFIVYVNEPPVMVNGTPSVTHIGHYYAILNDGGYYLLADSTLRAIKMKTFKGTWELLTAKNVQYIIIIYK